MLSAAGAAAVVALSAWTVTAIRRWRRKSPEEIERLRRLDLHRQGRITHGHILDVMETPADPVPRTTVFYAYEVAGVSYEVGQDVTALPEIAARAQTLPGHDVLVKHDRRQPANSIVACEDWTGVSGLSD
jgi:hypothetical protein